MLSSDAVFTGPWMFHEEDCPSLCDSPQAVAIHEAEAGALAAHPKALVVRTHAFGWSPTGDSWLERRLSDLERRRERPADTQRHATPILATDLAAVVAKALDANTTGVVHVAGAERVNPTQFLQQLAREFGVPPVNSRTAGPTADRQDGFGRGETSLDCRRARLELGVSLPMLAEGLRRLRKQRDNGFRDRLGTRCETLQYAA
jgi:dTDP-4-dehydrorhamnose reductase